VIAVAYTCPKCGGQVQRKSSTAAGAAGGLVGALLFAAFAGLECGSCGKISTRDFPGDVRRKIRMRTVAMVVGALVISVVAVIVLVALKPN
jgi:hypothetical protein